MLAPQATDGPHLLSRPYVYDNVETREPPDQHAAFNLPRARGGCAVDWIIAFLRGLDTGAATGHATALTAVRSLPVKPEKSQLERLPRSRGLVAELVDRDHQTNNGRN